jgi:hypothetical protein
MGAAPRRARPRPSPPRRRRPACRRGRGGSARCSGSCNRYGPWMCQYDIHRLSLRHALWRLQPTLPPNSPPSPKEDAPRKDGGSFFVWCGVSGGGSCRTRTYNPLIKSRRVCSGGTTGSTPSDCASASRWSVDSVVGPAPTTSTVERRSKSCPTFFNPFGVEGALRFKDATRAAGGTSRRRRSGRTSRRAGRGAPRAPR